MKEQFVAVESLMLLLVTWFSVFFMPKSPSMSLSCVHLLHTKADSFLVLTIAAKPNSAEVRERGASLGPFNSEILLVSGVCSVSCTAGCHT